MYKLYRIINNKSKSSYIGMTKMSLSKRFSNHKYWATTKRKTKLYDAMRKYGVENFSIILLEEFNTKQECCEAEKALIASEDNLYNLASGGEGGFVVVDINQWKLKLSASRKGRTPFIGRQHSDETKRKCSEAAKKYWASKRAENNDLS